MKRVLLAGMKHETNTFATGKTGMSEYRDRVLLMGDEVLDYFNGTKTEYGGMMAAAAKAGFCLVPVIAADAQPGPKVSREVFEFVTGKIIDKLTSEQIDGILLVLHGAMVLEDSFDGEGELLKTIRQYAKDIPVIATLDMHCNLTAAMVENATAFFAYDTYPHIDLFERGFEAGSVMARIFRGELKPVMSYKKLPLISSSLPTTSEPMQSLMNKVFELESNEDVVAVSFLQGFRLADIPDMCVSLLAVTNDNKALGETIVANLANDVWAKRALFQRQPTPLEKAVREAIVAPNGPIILADISDNPGSGGPCDGTQLLAELIKQGAKNVAFVLIKDPESVERAVDAGVGNKVNLLLGGKTEDRSMHGDPLAVEGIVRTITDGRFYNKGPMNQGMLIDVGRLVVVEVDGIEILISERKHQPYDPEIMRRVGICPEDKKIIVVKSLAHFRAAYSAFAKGIIEVDLPGVAAINPRMIPYKNVTRPIYPLDVIEEVEL